MHLPICGAGYLGVSSNLDASRSVNLYPEISPRDAKDVIALLGTPGTAPWAGFGSGVVRGTHVFGGLLYVVIGGKLYSLTAAGVMSAPLGTLQTSSGRVLMADNGLAASGVGGNQLMIIDGVAGYIYNISTAAFAAISGGGWPGNPIALAYIDGYFVVAPSGSMSAYASNLYDGTTWNALATSPISAAPDLIKCIFNMEQQLWIIKEYTSEVWYDAGVPTSQGFPFQRSGAAVLDYGTPAPWSAARGGNSLFFLANERHNDGGELVGVVQIVGQGGNPQVVSPPPINYRIGQLSTVVDAFGYCYSDGGHTFYVLTFPQGNATFVYDASTGLWHERSTWTGGAYAIGRHVGNCYAYFAGMHLIGDWQSGNIYKMQAGIYTDNGQPIVSVRTCQHVADKKDLQNIFIKRLHVDMETGVGGSAALSWSDDGGHTWSNDYTASIGAVGQYKARAVWRRLGVSRDRIFRVAVSDPVKRVILGAYGE